MNIKEIDAVARSQFTYLTDGVMDTWRSHLQDVEAHRGWKGDCDDLTSTVLDMLSRQGVDLSNLYRLLVSSTGNNVIDHMVGCVVDDQNNWWIVGDTFASCYPAAQCLHKIIEYNCLTERNAKGALWRGGSPFE